MDNATVTTAAPIASGSERPSLSVVVPVYNEEAVLGEFHRRLGAVLDGLAADCEVVYVNDGSRDATMALLRQRPRRRRPGGSHRPFPQFRQGSGDERRS